jgi:hypothetical protein
MRRRWFFGVSLTETARWTIAVIFLAVAVLATPMPMALYIAIAIISWVLLVCWVTICIRWDFFRWHWPFVSFEIEEQVHRGIFLQKEPGTAGEEACRKWRDETRARIEARWGFYSSQLKTFDNTHGVSITLSRATVGNTRVGRGVMVIAIGFEWTIIRSRNAVTLPARLASMRSRRIGSRVDIAVSTP